MDLADRVAALEKYLAALMERVALLTEQVRKLSGNRTEAEIVKSAKGEK